MTSRSELHEATAAIEICLDRVQCAWLKSEVIDSVGSLTFVSFEY